MTSNRPAHPTPLSSIHEARILVRRCAEPSPAGESVKAAMRRASARLSFRYSRIRDLWYAAARRITAEEMDELRRAAEQADFASAVTCMGALKNRMLEFPSSAEPEVVERLTNAIEAVARNADVLAFKPKAQSSVTLP
jgi:hypothetical protein